MSDRAHTDGSEAVVEVEFHLRDAAYPFVRGSAEAGCTFELAKMIPRTEGAHSEFFHIQGAESDRIVALSDGLETADVSLLTEYERGGLFEFLVSGDCPAYTLAELGALPQIVESRDGVGRIVADIPAGYDAPAIVEAFLAAESDAELVKKCEKGSVTPIFSIAGFQQVLRIQLTGRQHEIMRIAFEKGYYEWPRGCTGQDIAAELGISSATFSEHIQAAERKLLTLLFDGTDTTWPLDTDTTRTLDTDTTRTLDTDTTRPHGEE